MSLALADLALLDARLVCGDFEGVLDLLRTATPSPALPLFVARYVRWTGDLQSADAVWSHVRASLDPPFMEQLHPALRHASLTAIAPTATDLGDPAMAARLLAIARRIDTPEAARRRDSSTPANTDGSPQAANDPHVQRVDDVAFDMLGIDPDAARGRLRLRPRLDAADELAARNVRFGDGSVRIHAFRESDVLTIRIEQDAGSIPITLLLEPFVRRTGPVTVDGRPADLVPQTAEQNPPRPALITPYGGSGTVTAGPHAATAGTIVPVQLVLDELRTLVIRENGEPGADQKKGPVT